MDGKNIDIFKKLGIHFRSAAGCALFSEDWREPQVEGNAQQLSRVGATASVGSAARSLIELTVHRLRRDILEGHLASGSRLAVAHLKDNYEVSGGTMREALSLLVSEGLAQAEAQRGFRVAPMSLADMEDLTRTRVLVECETLRQSVRLGGDQWRSEVTSTFDRLSRIHPRTVKNPRVWFERWERCNRDFHEALLSACPSQWSRRFRDVLYLHMERYRRLTAHHPSPGRDVHAEHLAIHDAALARDEALCASLLKSHIEASLEAVRQHGLLPPVVRFLVG